MAEDDKYDKLQKMATDPKELVDMLSEISFLPPEEYRKKIRGSGGSRRVPLEVGDDGEENSESTDITAEELRAYVEELVKISV